MDSASKRELSDIKREIRSIINELNDIASDIKRDFDGIGEDKYAACIDRVVEKYEYVLKKLNNMDTNKLVECFKAII